MAFLPNEPYTYPQDHLEPVPHAFYSHGLEKIYALESVDVRSIRKISSAAHTSDSLIKDDISSTPLQNQLEFDYGSTFKSNLESFIFREPIQVLGYSRRIEKWLVEQGKLTLGDLLENDKQTIIPLKGLGQGHFDEISNKLQQYLKIAAKTAPKIDFTSWLKTILADIEPKKSAALLESYGLPVLIPLSPADNAELRKSTDEQRAEIIQEALFNVQTDQKKQHIFADVQQISEIFIKPWLYLRASISNQQEIIDQLLKLSGFHPHLDKILELISATYFESHFLFDPFLLTVDEGLYCHNMESAEAYYDVMQIASTYFYRQDLTYPLDSLIAWISRELAKNWRAWPDHFIERTLRLSRNFRIRREFNDQLIIKLS